MSDNKFWAVCWIALASTVIAITLSIAYCSVQETSHLYRVQEICIQKNAAWSEQSKRDSTQSIHTCTFTR